MSFVERSIILCSYLGGSTIGGFTVDHIMQNIPGQKTCPHGLIVTDASSSLHIGHILTSFEIALTSFWKIWNETSRTESDIDTSYHFIWENKQTNKQSRCIHIITYLASWALLGSLCTCTAHDCMATRIELDINWSLTQEAWFTVCVCDGCQIKSCHVSTAKPHHITLKYHRHPN